MDVGLFMERYGYKLLMILMASVVIGIIGTPIILMAAGLRADMTSVAIVTLLLFLLGAVIFAFSSGRQSISDTLTRTPNRVFYGKEEKGEE